MFLPPLRLRLRQSAAGALLLSGFLVLFGLTVTLSFKPRHEPAAVVGPGGHAVLNTPLDEPMFSDAQILELAGAWAEDCQTYGFADYQSRLEGTCRGHFTDTAFSAYTDALRVSGRIHAIVSNFALQTAHYKSPGVVIRKEINSDATYQWTVQIPVQETILNDAHHYDRSSMVELQLVRQSPAVSLPPIAITGWIER